MDTIVNEKKVVNASRAVGNVTYIYRYVIEDNILQEVVCTLNRYVTQAFLNTEGVPEQSSSMQQFGGISYVGGQINISIVEGENIVVHSTEFDDILATVKATINETLVTPV